MKKQKAIPVVIRRSKGTGQMIVLYPKPGQKPGICRVEREVPTTVLRDSSGDYDQIMEATEPARCDDEARILKKIFLDTGLKVVAKKRWGVPKKVVANAV